MIDDVESALMNGEQVAKSQVDFIPQPTYMTYLHIDSDMRVVQSNDHSAKVRQRDFHKANLSCPVSSEAPTTPTPVPTPVPVPVPFGIGN